MYGCIIDAEKILPLHGSVIAINGKAYAFVGRSGAGKSTLASALLRKGYQLLSDDVIAVSLSEDNIPFVTPSYPQQKLWKESLDQFGMETTHYQPLFERETKYAVPVSSKFLNESLPLAGIFELVKVENEDVEIHQIEGLERLRTLLRHTYRNSLIPRLGMMDWHFMQSTSIVNKVDMFQLRRPISKFTVHDLVSTILESLKEEEKMMSKQEISLNSFIVQGQENVVSDMDGEKVMMSIHNGKYYNLGGLGGEIWDLINELISVDQLVNILMSRYAIEEAECKKQVLSFLNHLYSEGLILINEKG